jgi:hypothetical protein
MSTIDYSAKSIVWVLPFKKTRVSAQQAAGHHQVPLSEAITVFLGLPADQQSRASIEVAGRTERIGKDEALAISKRSDFPG